MVFSYYTSTLILPRHSDVIIM